MTIRHILIVASTAWGILALGALIGMTAMFGRPASVSGPAIVWTLVALVGALGALTVVAVAVVSRRLFSSRSRKPGDPQWDAARATRELERFHREQTVVARFAESCTRFQDAAESYREMTRQMAQAVGAGVCFLMRYEKAANKMVAQGPGYGVSSDAIKTAQYTVTPEVKAAWNFSTQGSLLSNDPQGDRRVLRAIADGLSLYNCAVVPFFFEGRVTGLIVVANKARWFTSDDVRLLSAFAHYTSLAVANLQLHHEVRRTIRDGLTGLYTAHHFRNALNDTLAALEGRHQDCSVVAVSIDEFHSCRDLYGRAGADRIVKEVGALLAGHADGGAMVARYGAQEFAILLPRTNRDEAVAAAERMRTAVEEHQVAVDTGIPINVTVSVGVASLDTCGGDSLLHAAQTALRRASQSGKNLVVTAGVDA